MLVQALNRFGKMHPTVHIGTVSVIQSKPLDILAVVRDRPLHASNHGVVQNMDAWYDAFGVKPGDKLYLQEKRVRITLTARCGPDRVRHE